ncbi:MULTISPECIES: LytR C-terminal domain-containing protein [unclassified Salinibacterium]|uniref:LytR C-terminal domain-containing protein n=1 Tax=unclassified Salinibacterium TaxID=2632331 RepID=UPI0018CE6213|nr:MULTISPECIES: LytR C-terminal domain-containing protein [unclassified Salinibacterium]MBH0053497.1 LytR C-terminal domain-containing protein [Salinibacterium sp. SWN139]MBH0082765.1 LytR C-terminal domain-containing protein [Salinibacterium sp. SWN167]
MASYPKDRFDELPEDVDRIGAHRGPKRRGRGWIGFAWALLATGVLVFGGLFALSQYLDDDLGIPFFAAPEEPAVNPEPAETVAPVTDPATIDPERALTIDVLNGTPESGLQTTVFDELTAAGWPTGSAAPASSRDIEDTYVYYSNPDDEDVASGLVAAIGRGEIRLVEDDIFPGVELTVVIGTDYLAPAVEATEEPTE